MEGIFCKVWMVWMEPVGSKYREFELTCIILRYTQCHFEFSLLLVCTWRHGSHGGVLVVRKKGISLLWELNPIFCKFFKKKFYRIDHQHTTNMAALSWGCKPRIWVLSTFLITCNSYVRDEWIWLGKKWTV